MKVRQVLFMVAILLLVSVNAYANYSVVAPKVSAPVLDGKLNDEAWVKASLVGGKAVLDISNTADRISMFPRVGYIAYDDTNLYVAYSIYSANPNGLYTLADPGISNNDEVELFLLPAGKTDIIQIMIDAAGRLRQPDYGLSYAIGKTPIQWIVEFSVPFANLGVTPQAGDTWGINFAGHQIADGEQWICWSPTFGAFKNAKYFGTVTFK